MVFSEFCSFSNVVSIQDCNYQEFCTTIFLLDNGRVYYLMNGKINFLIHDIKNITVCTQFLYTLNNDGKLLKFAMRNSGNLDIIERSKSSGSDSIFIKDFIPIGFNCTPNEPEAIVIGLNNELCEANGSLSCTIHENVLPGPRNKSAKK